MSKRRGSFISQDVRDDAKAIGANRYVQGKRYKAQRERIFQMLDDSVTYMSEEEFGNPYDPTAIGGFASAIVSADGKARGQLKQAKVKGMADADTRRDLFRLIGLLVADDYLKARRENIPAETRLSLPKRAFNRLDSMLRSAVEFGEQLSAEDYYAKELVVSYPDDDALGVAQAMIEQAIADYESLVPEAGGDSEVPDPVERKAIAKAALMRLHVDHLEEEASREGFDDLPTKSAMASAIAEKYADDLDKIAEIVLSRERGDPDYGLITRLVPLRQVPSLDAAETAFKSLDGRYIEARTASFFIFGKTERQDTLLIVQGKVRSFTVNPAEAGGAARINAKPFNDEIVIRLREGSKWAEVNARRTGDLSIVRSVLRRTGEVVPAAAVQVPDRLTSAPYDGWDPRTLWMLDFLRRDLRSDELTLDNTLMAHFLAPERDKDDDDEVEPEDPRRPTLDAVRLLGSQLQDHPEACQRIAAGSRLRDLDIRVRSVYDRARGLSKLVRFRLSWENDHLAVLSGATDGHPDADLHRKMVYLIRMAAPRQLDENALKFALRLIERRAEGEDLDQDLPGVLDDEGSAA